MTLPLISAEQTTGTPTVTVAITSYKSERWIGRALDSVLQQRAPFGVEILIADDCSPDGTVAVVREYESRYPGLIRVIARSENVGTQRNYYDAFEQSRGKYIAWLDHDDYWTDPDKLALQVEALEADPSLMICGHYVRWVSRDATTDVKRPRYPEMPAGRYGMETILRRNFLPSPSVMFRNGLHRDLPEWYFEISPTTDWPLYIVAARKGDILLLDRVMADYTLNPTSAFWGAGDLFWYEQDARFYRYAESIVPQRFLKQVRAERGRRYESIAYLLRKQGKFAESRRAAVEAFRSPAITDNIATKTKALVAALVREAQWRKRGSNKPSGE